MKNKMLIIGSGGHTLSCISLLLKKLNKFKIVGLVDDVKTNLAIKYKIIGNDFDLKILKQKISYAFIGLGQIKSPKIRKNLFRKLKKYNYKLPFIISKIIRCSQRY